jgi:hypothetical protein
VDILQRPDSATSTKEDQDVGISRVQLPRPFFPEELSAVEVETRVCKVLDSTIILSPGDGPNPL